MIATTLTMAAFYGQYPPGDVAITRAIQSVRFPGLQFLSDVVYYSGKFPGLHIIWVSISLGLFLGRHRLMSLLLLLGLAAHNFAFLLKIFVERPRPSPSLVDVARFSGGWSFPSGHTMSAVLLWGLVFLAAGELIQARAWRLAVQGFSVSMVALMGLQRVYAGAHWPTDVLAAYLWGGLILFGLYRLFRLMRSLRSPAPSYAAA